MKPKIDESVRKMMSVFPGLIQHPEFFQGQSEYCSTWLKKGTDNTLDAIYFEYSKEHQALPEVVSAIKIFEQISLIPNLNLIGSQLGIGLQYPNQKIPMNKITGNNYIFTVTSLDQSFTNRIDYI